MKRVTVIALCLISSLAHGQAQRAFVDALFGQPSGGTTVTRFSDLVTYINFNSGDSSYQADQSGKGNHWQQLTSTRLGTVSGGYITVSPGTGGVQEDSIDSVSSTLLNNLSAATFGVWLNYRGAATTLKMPLWTRGTAGAKVHGLIVPGVSSMKYDAQVRAIYAEGGTLTTGVWHHVACVWSDGAYVKLYVDGVPTATNVTFTSPMVVDDIWTCGREETSGRAFTGYLDEVRMYSVAMSDAEVAAWYAEGRP